MKLSAEDYAISPEQISAAAMHVIEGLQEAGFDAYLVGGCVRDLMLGAKPKDFDVATNAEPEQVADIFRQCRLIGRRFRIAHVRHRGEIIEVSTFRGNPGDKENLSRHEMRLGDEGQLIRDNVFGTRDEDAMRRDFTVNALYYDPTEGCILDFMDSVSDIKNGVLKSIGDTEQRFIEDPVRMLRMVRFAAKLDFTMEEEARELIHKNANLLAHVSAPRMFEEVLKLFHGGQAVRSFEMLREFGLFRIMFPFTEQHLVDGEPGLAERALVNTDARIQVGKPVIPAFLFACLLWDPVREDANNLMDSGTPPAKAWRVAMMDALRDQSQYVSIPRRLADMVMEIWVLQFRLLKRQPASIFSLLNNRRFRASYDFMLLRAELNEIDRDIADWWTDIQELDDAAKKALIADLLDEDAVDDDEPNFNTYHHTSGDNAGNRRQSRGGRNRRGKQGKQGKPQGKSHKRNTRNRSTKAKTGNGAEKKTQAGKKGKRRVSKTSRSNPYRSRQKNNKEASYLG